MKTIWVRIYDGNNVTACSTKKKALKRIADNNPDITLREANEILNNEWQEIYIDL